MKIIKTPTVVIASGGTTSGELALTDDERLIAVQTPSALTGTTFTFTTCNASGGTFLPVYYEGTQYSITVGASRHIALDPRVFAGAQYIKIVSGSTEGADRTITCQIRPVG